MDDYNKFVVGVLIVFTIVFSTILISMIIDHNVQSAKARDFCESVNMKYSYYKCYTEGFIQGDTYHPSESKEIKYYEGEWIWGNRSD